MRISVIIPTRNSARTLAPLLNDLAQQSRQPDEVIVPDGLSTDATLEIIAGAGFRAVPNPQRHAAAGRNLAAIAATGDWLAFTDSDCRLPPDWLEQAANLITHNPDLVALAGPMHALPPANEIERVAGAAFLDGVMQFPHSTMRVGKRTLRGAFLTANVFYQTQAFRSVGGFDEWFENYAEDVDLFWRTLKRYPGRLLFSPDVWVQHCFPATWRALFSKWHQYGMASCYLQKRHLDLVNLDGSHYRRLGVAAAALISHSLQRTSTIGDSAKMVQLAGHLSGKIAGSFKLGLVNL